VGRFFGGEGEAETNGDDKTQEAADEIWVQPGGDEAVDVWIPAELLESFEVGVDDELDEAGYTYEKRGGDGAVDEGFGIFLGVDFVHHDEGEEGVGEVADEVCGAEGDLFEW